MKRLKKTEPELSPKGHNEFACMHGIQPHAFPSLLESLVFLKLKQNIHPSPDKNHGLNVFLDKSMF